MIAKITTKTHEEWLDLRRQYIGGSDAGAVVGLNPYKSLYTLWAEKTGRWDGFHGNLATEVGTYLEDFVARKFAAETGKKVRNCNQSMVNDLYPWAIANVDRLIVGEDAGLEIKTTSELNLRKIRGVDFPDQYYAQCVHYMAVTGKARWYLAVLVGNRSFHTFCLERDQAEIDALMDAERRFWYDNVLADVEPDADGSGSTTDTISGMYPNSDGGDMVLTGFDADLRRYKEVTEMIASLKDEREAIQNRIKSEMGECETATAENASVTWKTSSRTSIDTKQLAEDHPEIDLDDYRRSTSVRTFKIKIKE